MTIPPRTRRSKFARGRNYLEKGNLNRANKFLGREWTIDGIVQKGRQVGKKIGFPTCNINIKDYVLAQPGVYAVRVIRNKNITDSFYLNNRKLMSKINIKNSKSDLMKYCFKISKKNFY